jgi:phosphatidylglycerophosphate synthase
MALCELPLRGSSWAVLPRRCVASRGPLASGLMIHAIALTPSPPTPHLREHFVGAAEHLTSPQRLALLPTLFRLPLGLGVAALVVSGQAQIAVAALAAFVLIDVLDGIVARWISEETAIRRAADSAIDKVAIHSVAFAVFLAAPDFAPWWGLLILRDILQSFVAWRTLRITGLVVNGAGWHALFTSCVAAWGAAWILGYEPWTIVSAGLCVLGFATLITMHRSAQSSPLGQPVGARESVVN